MRVARGGAGGRGERDPAGGVQDWAGGSGGYVSGPPRPHAECAGGAARDGPGDVGGVVRDDAAHPQRQRAVALDAAGEGVGPDAERVVLGDRRSDLGVRARDVEVQEVRAARLDRGRVVGRHLRGGPPEMSETPVVLDRGHDARRVRVDEHRPFQPPGLDHGGQLRDRGRILRLDREDVPAAEFIQEAFDGRDREIGVPGRGSAARVEPCGGQLRGGDLRGGPGQRPEAGTASRDRGCGPGALLGSAGRGRRPVFRYPYRLVGLRRGACSCAAG